MVEIFGFGFTGATGVSFGTTAAQSFTVVSDTEIDAVTPVHAAGSVDVVTTSAGTSPIITADQYSFEDKLMLTDIQPGQADTAGGTMVTLTGSGLAAVTDVYFKEGFGDVPAQFTINSDTSITVVTPVSQSYFLSLVVVSPYGSQYLGFQFNPNPQMPGPCSLKFSSGPLSGGSDVVYGLFPWCLVDASGNPDVTGVFFGDTPVGFSEVHDPTSGWILQVTVPPYAGQVDVPVVIVNPYGLSALTQQCTYHYDAAAPSVSAVNPAGCGQAGGVAVTLTGSNFTSATDVFFGTVPATDFTLISDTEIIATAPAQAAGVVDVTVGNAFGTSAAVAGDHFSYLTSPVPSVTAVNPSSGPQAGTDVTISGSYFTGASAVYFGSLAATAFRVVSDSQIVATAPPQAAEVVNVTVSTPYGTSATSSADQFTYVAAPTVTQVSPWYGPASGGTSVTITGTNFTVPVAVYFGNVPAASITVVSPTEIIARAPSEPSDVVDVTVTTSKGGSAVTASDTFTYSDPLVITLTSLPDWTAGFGFWQFITTTGGAGPLTFSTFSSTGSLPTGLTLRSDGLLSGTPIVVGSYSFTVYSFTVRVADAVGGAATQSYSLVIYPAVTMTTTSLANWTINSPGYSQPISASGGTGSITFARTAGALPGGLTLSSAGVLTGTPTTVGTFLLTVTATDGVGASASQSYTVVINGPVVITTTSVANWTVNLPGYHQTITASGGTGSTTFALTAGTLPAGLTLSSSGILTGTPTTANTYTFTVTATDTVGATATRQYSVSINPAVVEGLLTLANFNSAVGANPAAGLVADANGNLYGATKSGGSFGYGTLFELQHGSGTITTLASFNGLTAVTALLVDSAGNVFGTAGATSDDGYGTVFELQHGSGAITTLLYFNGSQGASPAGGLTEDRHGNLFGTTSAGGHYGDGTVFELVNGLAGYYLSSLVSFNGSNGAAPSGALVEDSSGNLFGTTTYGGSSGSQGYGTVFEVQNGAGTITTLASFNSSNGAYPYSGVIEDGSGNLYGSASGGGSYGHGLVFEVRAGSAVISPLFLFNGSNGAAPLGGLVRDRMGDLFGTTSGGGASNQGTVFELAYNYVSGSYSAFSTVVNFNGADGAAPSGSLVVNTSGNVFGTTASGGTANGGTLYEASALWVSWTRGQPGIIEAIVASGGTGMLSFSGTASFLPPGVVLSSSGIVSGAPASINTYTFVVAATDSVGATATQSYTVVINPPITIGASPNIYWTRHPALFTLAVGGSGGTGPLTYSVSSGSLPGYLTLSTNGVVSGGLPFVGSFNFTITVTDAIGATASQPFQLVVNPQPWAWPLQGSTPFKDLADLPSGANPICGVVEDIHGNLYGTTSNDGVYGEGTIFELPFNSSTGGYGSLMTLVTFEGSNGANPSGT